MLQVEKYKVQNARNSLCSSTQFRLSTADAAKVAQFVCETGQGYSLSSEELQFTFVNCLQIIHKFKHEHEKENSLHVVGAVGPLTMSCIGDTDSNKQQSWCKVAAASRTHGKSPSVI